MSENEDRREDEDLPEEEGGFFAEYWIWILAPLVLILGALIYMVAFTGGDDSPFQYGLY